MNTLIMTSIIAQDVKSQYSQFTCIQLKKFSFTLIETVNYEHKPLLRFIYGNIKIYQTYQYSSSDKAREKKTIQMATKKQLNFMKTFLKLSVPQIIN